MPKTPIIALLTALACLCWSPVSAEDVSRKEMRSLDEQVQEIKSDVLSIAAELDQLEERLLFPSNTQLTVFLAVGDGTESFRLDSIRLGINDALATHHIYSFKELEALQKGGVQRIYTGNIPTGNHEIGVTVNGKLKIGGLNFCTRIGTEE